MLKIVTRLFCNVDTWWSVLVGFKLVARVFWLVARVLKVVTRVFCNVDTWWSGLDWFQIGC